MTRTDRKSQVQRSVGSKDRD